MLGVLGSYIGRIYTQVQARPLYTVASVRPAARGEAVEVGAVEAVADAEPRDRAATA
jgi:dolichol-phosphate mannosyltransferase